MNKQNTKEKVRTFFAKNKKALLNLLITLAFFVILSVVSALLLMAFNVIYFEDGMHFNEELFHSFRSAWYGWIVFIIIQTVLSIFLCVIPGAAMAFILLSQAIYPIAWQAFVLSFSSVMISSTVMYLVGRFGGYKLCAKFLGEEDCAKALGLLRDKGTVFFPFMMMFPIFPDDALVMIAGTLKMSLKWFIPSIVIGRGIGIATIIFGFSIIPFDKFTTPWHWIGFVAACAAFVALVFYAAFRFNKLLDSKRRARSNSDGDEKNEL